MKFCILFSALLAIASLLPAADVIDAKRMANTVVLDAVGVKNLRIETVEVEEADYEQSVFALGRIEVLPGKKAIVSSRIAGRAFSVLALPDQEVDEGEELMWVESRQPGDPPPTVMLPAPMAGIIAKVDVAVGQPIEPNDALIEIVDLTTVEAAARVPEHLAGKLAKEQTARIRVSGFADKVFEAKLAHLGAYADEQSGTVEAAFHVPNPDKLLRPGMRAEFSIVLGKREGVMSVPRSALQGEPSNRFLFVKDFDLPNAFVKTSVVVGETNAESVEIVTGLFPGDEVVTRGAYSLAFAGGGSISLKEALDAAHGHEHNVDGSEMTAEQKAAGSGGGHDHEHEGSSGWSMATSFFAASTALLLVLLLVLTVNRRKALA
ncbi:MAG: efflux RND transporter periplasmic adaptor subunit [Roseimicrobium sp.]